VYEVVQTQTFKQGLIVLENIQVIMTKRQCVSNIQHKRQL